VPKLRHLFPRHFGGPSMRTLRRWSMTRLVATSGYGFAGDYAKAKAAGFDAPMINRSQRRYCAQSLTDWVRVGPPLLYSCPCDDVSGYAKAAGVAPSTVAPEDWQGPHALIDCPGSSIGG
jgi:hypothetical protein